MSALARGQGSAFQDGLFSAMSGVVSDGVLGQAFRDGSLGQAFRDGSLGGNAADAAALTAMKARLQSLRVGTTGAGMLQRKRARAMSGFSELSTNQKYLVYAGGALLAGIGLYVVTKR